MKNKISISYKDIISIENLYIAWEEFLPGKKNKRDVVEFTLELPHNIFQLHSDLKNGRYKHGPYTAFSINDPKPRDIHKASVRDRLLHHAIYRILYPYFDRFFIFDSYSCRFAKGTHRALLRFKNFGLKVSKNDKTTCWVLKCDVRKFFASIDHKVLLNVLRKHIAEKDIMRLLENIIKSFHSSKVGIGLPLGNLTSQLLVNIYMNEFDQWAKHVMKIKYYVRYADDFVILSRDKDYLLELIPKIADFLTENLGLQLHPKKVSLKTLSSGIDFLGWVHFPDHRVLRTVTKRRMYKRIEKVEQKNDIWKLYKGLLKWGNTFKIIRDEGLIF